MLKIVYLYGLILFLNTSAFSQWEQLGFNNNWIFDVAVKGDYIFAGGSNQLYRSLDDGINWDTITTFPTEYIDIIQPIDELLLVGQNRGYYPPYPPSPTTSIYKSTDNGLTWDSVYAAILGTTQFQSFNQIIFADSDELLIRSSDDGDTWAVETSFGYGIVALAGNDTALFASKYQDSLYRSFDSGSTWHSIENGLPNTTKWNIVARKDTIFIYAGLVYRSTDNGNTWEGANNGLPNGISLSGIFWEDKYLFAASFDNRIFMTTINNINWVDISDGLIVTGNANITDITKTEEYIFASANTGIWRRPLSQVVSIDDLDQKNLSESHVILKQNYPNPFNPITKIKYSIPLSENVQIKIYDILGNEIKTLLNDYKQAGPHETEFNASNLPSGVYFYRIISGNFLETKKMLLLR